MKRYLDDDIAKGALASRLRKAGHLVVLPSSVGMSSASDPRHLLYAAQSGLAIGTKNHDDYRDLHLLVLGTHGQHSGIVVVRADNDPSRDMNDQDIARSLANLEAAGVPIANEFHILNHWR